jgi:hypothetical protein
MLPLPARPSTARGTLCCKIGRSTLGRRVSKGAFTSLSLRVEARGSQEHVRVRRAMRRRTPSDHELQHPHPEAIPYFLRYLLTEQNVSQARAEDGTPSLADGAAAVIVAVAVASAGRDAEGDPAVRPPRGDDFGIGVAVVVESVGYEAAAQVDRDDGDSIKDRHAMERHAALGGR